MFAAVSYAIGCIPIGSASQHIFIQSFGPLGPLFSLFAIGFLAPLASAPVPFLVSAVLMIIVALGYYMLLTLPSYFYFRCRRSSLIVLQLVVIAIHAALAVFVFYPQSWAHY